MILILKHESPRDRVLKFRIQMTATTKWQEIKKKTPSTPLQRLQANRRKRAPQVNPTALLKWKHPCDDWSRQNFVGPSAVGKHNQFSDFQQQFSPVFQAANVTNHNNAYNLPVYPRSLSWFKTFSKLASKFISSRLKMTESTISSLSWGETRYKRSKTLTT